MANGADYLNRKITKKYTDVKLAPTYNEWLKSAETKKWLEKTEGSRISSRAKKSMEKVAKQRKEKAEEEERQKRIDEAAQKATEHIAPLPIFKTPEATMTDQYTPVERRAYENYLEQANPENLPYNLTGFTTLLGEEAAKGLNPLAYALQQEQKETPKDMQNQKNMAGIWDKLIFGETNSEEKANEKYNNALQAYRDGGSQKDLADAITERIRTDVNADLGREPDGTLSPTQWNYGVESALRPAAASVGEGIIDTPIYLGAGIPYLLSYGIDQAFRGGEQSDVTKALGGYVENAINTHVLPDPEELIAQANEKYNPTEAQQTAMNLGRSVAEMVFGQALGQGMAGMASSASNVAGGTANSLNPAIKQGTATLSGKALDAATDPNLMSQITFASGAISNATQQAYKETGDPHRALSYGIMSGVVETAIENIANVAPGMFDENSITQTAISRIIDKLISNPTVNKAVNTLTNISGEGVEEIASAIIDPLVQYVSQLDTSITMPSWEELVENFAGGAIVAGVMRLGSGIALSGTQADMNTQSAITSTPQAKERASLVQPAEQKMLSPQESPIKSVVPLNGNGNTQTVQQDIQAQLGPIVEPTATLNIDGQQAIDAQTEVNAKNTANTIEKLPTFKDKSGLVKAVDSLYTAVVSGQAEMERVAKAQRKINEGAASIDDYTQLVRTAKAQADTILSEGMYDLDGNKIGKSLQEVEALIPTTEQTIYNEYLQNLHNIDRQKVGKPVLDRSAEESARIVAEMEAQHPEFRRARQELSQWWHGFMENYAVKSGLISKDQLAQWEAQYPNYIPTYREESNGSSGGKRLFGKRASIKADTVSKEATGATSPVKDYRDNYANLVQRYVKAARTNELIRNMADFAAANPGKAAPYMRLALKESINAKPLDNFEDIGRIDLDALKEVEQGKYQIRAYVDGKPVVLNVSKSIYNNMDNLLHRQTDPIERAGRKVTNPMKALITGLNQFFTVNNIARDFQTGIANSIENNPAKFTATYGEALAKMAKNSPEWQTFKALGGRESGFIKSGKSYTESTKKSKNPIKTAKDAAIKGLEFLPENSESLARFAEYLRGIKKYGDTPDGRRKAIMAAADVTTNFSRSGSSQFYRGLDAWTMYLNAGVQGVDKMVRQIKTRPVSTLSKAAGSSLSLVFLTQALIPWVMGAPNDEENPYYQDLDRRTKDLYYIIPNAMDRDENGIPKSFIKIPKSREWGQLLAASAQRAARQVAGRDDDAWKGYLALLGDSVAPNNPIEDNLFATFYQLQNNEDYGGRTIVPESLLDLEPRYQYDANTSEIGKTIGDWLNVSPKQIDYLIKQSTGFIGDMLLPATTGKPTDFAQGLQNIFLQPIERKFTADPLYQSGVVQDFYDDMDAAKREAATYDFVNNIEDDVKTPLDKKYSTYSQIAKEISDLRKQEKELLANEPNGPERQAKIDDIRMQINEKARMAEFYAAVDYEDAQANYIPEIADKSDTAQEKIRGYIDDGWTLEESQAIYEKGYTDDQIEALGKAKAQGISMERFDEHLQQLKAIGDRGDTRNGTGSSSGGITAQREYIRNSGESAAVQQILADMIGDDRDYSSEDAFKKSGWNESSTNKYGIAQKYIGPISVDEWEAIYKGTYTGQNQKKGDRIARLKKLGYSSAQAETLYQILEGYKKD